MFSAAPGTGAVCTACCKGRKNSFALDQWFQLAYTGYGLSTVTLRDPNDGDQNLQRKKVFSLYTTGDRRRILKTADTVYRTETTTDTGGDTTTFEYTYHTGTDSPAVKSRRTVLPAVAADDNGSGSSLKPLDHFEPDGRLTWSRDADGFIHFTAHDTGTGWRCPITLSDNNLR